MTTDAPISTLPIATAADEAPLSGLGLAPVRQSGIAALPFATDEDERLGPPPPPSGAPPGRPSGRQAGAILAGLLDLLPSGFAWTRDPDALLTGLLGAPAAELALFEAAAEALLLEVDPRRADALLVDYERVLGPDPCGTDLAGVSGGVDDRRRRAHQRWVAQGFQTPAYFEALCAALGVPATVSEGDVAVCGELQCGMDLAAESERYVWTVSLPATRVIEAEAGALEAGGFLGEIVPSLVECVVRRLAPAHTFPIFSYAGAP